MSDEIDKLLVSSIKELKDAVLGTQEQLHQGQLILQKLTTTVDRLAEEHKQCQSERKLNTNGRVKLEIEQQTYNKIYKPIWAIALLLIGGILIPMVKPYVMGFETATNRPSIIAND